MLETTRAVDTVVLDKTGTVITGATTVLGVVAADGTDRATLLRYAGALEAASEHPLAHAIARDAKAELGPLPTPPASVRSAAACTARSTATPSRSGGRAGWPSAACVRTPPWRRPPRAEHDGKTVVAVGWTAERAASWR